MRVERNRGAECDIAYLLKALDIVDELAKLKSRLELVYKVVETL